MGAQSAASRRAGIRWQDSAWAGCVVAAGAAVAMLVRGRLGWALAALAVAIGAAAAARALSLRHPGPMSHLGWWVLLLPRGWQSVARLERVLEPRPGERILEVGPGIGVYSLPMAAAIAPAGVLEVIDVQEEMLDRLGRRADRAGIRNILATCGNGELLPYPDDRFDAAYAISVIGEMPDPAASLRELARVVKPGGRLVIGESFSDPDFAAPSTVREMAARAGFACERRLGPAFGYFLKFRAPAG
jgi:SAM-dependent methyltransferase